MNKKESDEIKRNMAVAKAIDKKFAAGEFCLGFCPIRNDDCTSRCLAFQKCEIYGYRAIYMPKCKRFGGSGDYDNRDITFMYELYDKLESK